MKALLVRIGIDHSYGRWNAPVDAESGEFVYVPIPESSRTVFQEGMRTDYAAFLAAVDRFSERFPGTAPPPEELASLPCHLDPDFDHLTYGDNGERRGTRVTELGEGDLLVFYAGLRSDGGQARLVYAIVGLYVIDRVLRASEVPLPEHGRNADTRKVNPCATDVIAFGKPGRSGRLRRCLPIGELRDRAYRVRRDLLEAWGGLSVNDGYIQRSAVPPWFLDAERFYAWFLEQAPELEASNVPSPARDRPPVGVLRTKMTPARAATVPRNAHSGLVRVVIVHLRRPVRGNPNESRTDPFWEVGSFGCTGCHRRNLMNPRRADSLNGVRMAFAQGGPLGFRLVHLTPPVKTLHLPDRCEATWSPPEMPFRYDAAPLLIDNDGRTDFPRLRAALEGGRRTTWEAQFSSGFRSRREPLDDDVASELVATVERLRATAPADARARSYVDALPFPPPKIQKNRRAVYRELRGRLLQPPPPSSGRAKKGRGSARRC